MNALHNRLITAFEAATPAGRKEAHCRQDILDLTLFIGRWQQVLESALNGEEELTHHHLKKAFQLAMSSDGRTKPAKPPKGAPAVARYGDLK